MFIEGLWEGAQQKSRFRMNEKFSRRVREREIAYNHNIFNSITHFMTMGSLYQQSKNYNYVRSTLATY